MKKNKKPIDLERLGWPGWTLGPYGRARDWRLFAPDGSHYTAGEITGLRGMALDVDYLRGRVHEMQGQIDAHACHFSDGDLQALRTAMAILARRLPAFTGRRASGRATSSATAASRF